MNYEWKQKIFTPEDFEGAGHYIVREPGTKLEKATIDRTGYLSTIMYKVGYSQCTRRDEKALYCLIAMSDGLVREGYFTNTVSESGESIHVDKWIWNKFAGENSFEALTRLCEYLNNGPHKETYRMATVEEVVRVVLHQRNYRSV